jgi:hypothetical protein
MFPINISRESDMPQFRPGGALRKGRRAQGAADGDRADGSDRAGGVARFTRTTAILATVGAAALGYMAVTSYQRAGSRRGGGAALADDEKHAAQDFSSTRSAGPEAMRDPPKEWSSADEASDESFPASDPPPVGSRVD